MEQFPMDHAPKTGFRVVREDSRLLVISKEPGVSFHQKKEENIPSLLARVRGATGLKDLFPVHRLDEVTSGIMVFAKDQAVAREMGRLFGAGEVEKYYLALADGRPKKTMGTMTGDLVRSRRGQWRLTREMTNPSITQFISAPMGLGRRLYLLRPLTGRTHQLRVVMKALAVPILGDPAYGGPAREPRCCLHAWAMKFQLAGETITVECPPEPEGGFHGESFDSVVSGWSSPWSRAWPKNPLARKSRTPPKPGGTGPGGS